MISELVGVIKQLLSILHALFNKQTNSDKFTVYCLPSTKWEINSKVRIGEVTAGSILDP